MIDDIKKVLGNVAPFLGTLIGGPLGGVALKVISNTLLNKDNASSQEIADALNQSTPEQLLKLKEIDNNYQAKMAEIGLNEQKITILDRKNAREREILLRDHIPAFLAILITVGFYGILILIMFCSLQSSSRDILEIMLGAMGTAWISVVTYYFGSSYGSTLKTQLMSK